ncbi:MAG: hypothetical protein B7C24_10150 [Bacteroidetes bacterium 4572_77]|nr:MAG: hypothetical protein B7C24_10150 [Bacteroidetes bacterium 4572_77]
MYRYTAEVIRIVDGDTFDLVTDLGFNLKCKQRFRLQGIDTPETWRPQTEKELKHGQSATKFVNTVMPVGSFVTIDTYKDSSIYGRYGVQITLSDGNDLAALLITRGFAKKDFYESE